MHLTSQGTCKCGLRCPFRFDEQFSFDPTVIGLPDNSAYIDDTQALCKISHMYHSGTTINVTSTKHKSRTNSSPKFRVPKTSPPMTKKFVASACPRKREGVKRLQRLRVSESAKGGHREVKIECVEKSTGDEAKDVLQVPTSEALVKVGSNTSEDSPSPRTATLATLLKSSRELSLLTNLCTAKLAEPSQQQGKQESLHVSDPSENKSATSSPAVQNVTKSMTAVEDKSLVGDEISEVSSAVLQNSPLQGREELKVSIMLGNASSAPGEGSEVVKTLMVSIPRGGSEPEGPEVEQQAKGSSDPGVDSSPTGMETGHNVVEPKRDVDVSRHAEVESSCGGLNESRSSEETLSASESEFQGVGSQSVGFQEPDFQKGQHGSGRGTWQCLGDKEADSGDVHTMATSQHRKDDVAQEIVPPVSTTTGSVANTEEGGVPLQADKMDAECGDSMGGYGMVGAIGTCTSEPLDAKKHDTCTFTTEGELGGQKILRDGGQIESLTTLPHISPLAELPMSTTVPSAFTEFESFNAADLQKNYSTTETTPSPNQGGAQQPGADLQITTALASDSVASENQNVSLGINSQGVLCASPHVSSLPVPLMSTKYYSGCSSSSHSEEPQVHSLVVNGTHSKSDQADHVSAPNVPSSYAQEPATDQLEEVMLIPLPEVPLSVPANIQDSANSQCLMGNSVPSSATLLDTPHHPIPSIPSMNGVKLPADHCPTKPSAVTTHTINSKSPLAPISTNGIPINANPSQLQSGRIQEVGMLAENAGFFNGNSSPLRIPCGDTFLSPKRSPSKDIAMRDFHILIKPLREFNIRKRRSSERFESERERYSPDVGWGPSPKRQRFVTSKVVGESFEKTVESSPESFEGGPVSESEVTSVLCETTAERCEKELSTQEDPESAKLVAVLPRDLNIADLISMLQDSTPNSGAEASDTDLHSQAIGALATQIVDVAGTQGYVDGPSSILVLSHQSPELEAILQAAVTQQMESARPPNAGVCVDTGSGTAANHPASDGCFQLGTVLPSVPDKCDSVPSKVDVNQDQPALSKPTPEEQPVATLSISAEAVSTGEEIKDVCHSTERQGGDNEQRLSSGSVVSPVELHPLDDVHPQTLQDKELRSFSSPLEEPEHVLHSTSTVSFPVTKESITPYLKSPLSHSDSISPETKEMGRLKATGKDCRDIEQSRPSFEERSTAQNHVAANLRAEVQGEKEENLVNVGPDLERDLSCTELQASSETSSLDGQLSKVGRQTGMQRTPRAQVEAEDMFDSVDDNEKSSVEVAVDILLQLSRQFTSTSNKVDDPSDLKMSDQATGGDSGESVALNPSADDEAAVATSKDLKKSASKRGEEVAVMMEDIESEVSQLKSSDMVDATSNVAQIDHTGGKMGTIGTKDLECEETMKKEDLDDATAAEAVAELSEVNVSESSHRCPDGPAEVQEKRAVNIEHKLASSPKVTMHQKSSSSEVQEEEEDGRLVRESRSEPPPCSRRSRNQPSFTSLDQDTDPLMSSSGSGFSFSSCSDTSGSSTLAGKQSNSPTTSTSTKSPTPTPISERPPISRGKHKPTPVSLPHPKRLIVSIPLDKVSIVHYSILECYPTPVFGVGDIVWAKASLLPGEALSALYLLYSVQV